MIKGDKVSIELNEYKRRYYIKRGYDIKDSMKSIDIDISTLTKGSKVRITAICEICNSENNIQYSKYLINFNRNDKGYYSCFKCKNIERRKTCIEKYGVDSYSKTDEFKEFISDKLDYVDIHEKVKKTNIERYGVEHYFQMDEVKEMNRIWMSSDEFKSKSKESILNKYGVDSYSKTDEFKKRISDNKNNIISKIIETNVEKYGVNWYSMTDEWKSNYRSKYSEIREKVIRTCLDRYGVDNVSKVEEIMNLVMISKEENGVTINRELLDDWEIYKRLVRKFTERTKNDLYTNWDGYDYYDGEEIYKYLELDHTDPKYPTIDHKISTFYGFSNNIIPLYISDISNLCITKRSINSSKSKLTEMEYESKLP